MVLRRQLELSTEDQMNDRPKRLRAVVSYDSIHESAKAKLGSNFKRQCSKLLHQWWNDIGLDSEIYSCT